MVLPNNTVECNSTFESANKLYNVITEMKATNQYLPVALFAMLCKMYLTVL